MNQDPEVLAIREDYRKQLDVEDAIMSLPGFDLVAAEEIFAALHRRLEQRYENMSQRLEFALRELAKALEEEAK